MSRKDCTKPYPPSPTFRQEFVFFISHKVSFKLFFEKSTSQQIRQFILYYY